MACSALVTSFAYWHWMLVLKGITTIEYLSITRLSKTRSPSDLKFTPLTSWRENLYLRFGTSNLFSIILPFTRKTPSITGLEWTFLSHSAEDTEALVPSEGVDIIS